MGMKNYGFTIYNAATGEVLMKQEGAEASVTILTALITDRSDLHELVLTQTVDLNTDLRIECEDILGAPYVIGTFYVCGMRLVANDLITTEGLDKAMVFTCEHLPEITFSEAVRFAREAVSVEAEVEAAAQRSE